MVKDLESPSAAPTRRNVRQTAGPLLLWAVDIGYTVHMVGKYLGRIAAASASDGFVFVRVTVLGKTLVFVSVSLQ